jgi:hypothetical protein
MDTGRWVFKMRGDGAYKMKKKYVFRKYVQNDDTTDIYLLNFAKCAAKREKNLKTPDNN